MKDIVLIPTYLRPEYLWLCLEKLSECKNPGTDYEFWICADRRPNDDVTWRLVHQWEQETFAYWKKKLPLFWYEVAPHTFPGNSYNVLRSYERAYRTDARNVFLVEDDVLVTPDFFQWHEAIAEREPNGACSIAYRCSRNCDALTGITDPGAYFNTARDYASIGVRWPRLNLAHLLEHITPRYFNRQDAYMQERFPGNRFAGDFAEQDGLIMRIMWEQKWFTVWPYVPRCYHMGWYGYHRPNGVRPNGWLEQKVGALRSMISDADALKRVAPDFGDIEPYKGLGELQTTSTFTKLQHFD